MALKTYEVVGACAVHGYKPGERADLDLHPDQEALFLAGGHLRVAAPPRTDLTHLSRDELNGLATALGIEGAERLPNKNAVADAIAGKE